MGQGAKHEIKIKERAPFQHMPKSHVPGISGIGGIDPDASSALL